MKKHKNISAAILAVSALLLGLLFVFPLWQITLGAPQYPDDLEMNIWINKITGSDEFTLQNINILNHYIGMAPIHPESFAELRYMPWIVIGLLITGLIAALTRMKSIMAVWLVLLMGLGAVGLWDFYRWEQEFGNNLDPRAPIKLEGMSYSPPFIGKKVLLNIEATSYPATGGLILFLSVGLGIVAVLYPFRFGKSSQKAKAKQEKPIRAKVAYAGGMALVLLTSACDIKAEPIEYGHDGCELCKMTITDNRYGTELVTSKGKIFKYDSIECLGRYVNQNSNLKYHSVHITDYTNPGTLVDAEKAFYLYSKNLPSPMGAYLTGFASEEEARKVHKEKGGEILSWSQMLAHLKK